MVVVKEKTFYSGAEQISGFGSSQIALQLVNENERKRFEDVKSFNFFVDVGLMWVNGKFLD